MTSGAPYVRMSENSSERTWVIAREYAVVLRESTATIPEVLPPALFEIPERIGPYRRLEVLGEGGMGTVVLAEQTEPLPSGEGSSDAVQAAASAAGSKPFSAQVAEMKLEREEVAERLRLLNATSRPRVAAG